MIEAWIKRRALKQYIVNLSFDLADRYGVREYYSIGQLRSTIKQNKYSERYSDYAAVLYLADLDASKFIGDRGSVKKLRGEISKKYFGGDDNFQVKLRQKRLIGNFGGSSFDGFDD